jgi:hypothetical protein
MKRIRIELKLLEDLHTGSGMGAGDIDALLACDRDGLPVLRASHLRGVWADALAHDKDREALFGASRRAAGQLSMTSFYALGEEADKLLWSSTSFKANSRAPEEDTLRTRQFVAAGSRFAATAWLPEGLEPALLRTASRADAFGGRRRRGDGVVQITNWKAEEDSRADFIGEPVGETPKLRLLLRAEDPLCLAQTGFPGNILPSECYLRGQQLLGALVKPLLEAGQIEVAAAWLRRKVHVGNAYPLPESAKRKKTGLPDDWQTASVLPIPLCYQRDKPGGGGADFPWWAVAPKPGEAPVKVVDALPPDGTRPEGKHKRPGEREFLFRAQYNDETGWQSFTAPLSLRMRNALPRKGNAMLPDNPDGSLFTQEEIPERTRFIADIRFPDADTAKRLADNLRPFIGGGLCLNIGRGGAPVVIEAAAWLPLSGKTETSNKASLELLLSSDMIARDSHLAFLENLDAAALAGLCGLEQKTVAALQAHGDADGVADTVEIHGFNALTGLPRMPALALRRGSCWRFYGPAEAIAELRAALERHQETGLGERCWEGFGQFLLDFHERIPTDNIRRHAAPAETPPPNALEQAIAAAERVWAMATKPDKLPRLTHWQRLRAATFQGADGLLERLKQIRKNPHAHDTLKGFAEWLENALQAEKDRHGVPIDECYRQLARLARLELRDQEEE